MEEYLIEVRARSLHMHEVETGECVIEVWKHLYWEDREWYMSRAQICIENLRYSPLTAPPPESDRHV